MEFEISPVPVVQVHLGVEVDRSEERHLDQVADDTPTYRQAGPDPTYTETVHGVYFCGVYFREGVRSGDIEESDKGREGEACISDEKVSTIRNWTPTEIDICHGNGFIESKEVGKNGSEPLNVEADADT